MVRSAVFRDSQALLRAMEEANQRVLEAGRSDSSLEGMAQLVARWKPGRLDIASVGDSRAYTLDARGLDAVTDDQTWVNEVAAAGLDETTLRNHPMRHVLTMAIGRAGRSRSTVTRGARNRIVGFDVQRRPAWGGGCGRVTADPRSRRNGAPLKRSAAN